MTYREIYFSLIKQNDPKFNRTVVKELLLDNGGFVDFINLLNNFDTNVKDEEKLNKYIEEIKKGVPLQYVIGHTYFINGIYNVNPDVLIPRPETEQLAANVMSTVKKMFVEKGINDINIADIGTGSGCIAIYLKEYFKDAHVYGVDISSKALDTAKNNADLHKVSIDFVLDNMVDHFIKNDIKLDVLVSNPPYIENKNNIDSNVWDYEPHLALLANPATKYYEEIISHADEIMNEKFFMAFEIDEQMESELSLIIEKYLPDVLYKFGEDMYKKLRYLYIFRTEKVKA